MCEIDFPLCDLVLQGYYLRTGYGKSFRGYVAQVRKARPKLANIPALFASFAMRSNVARMNCRVTRTSNIRALGLPSVDAACLGILDTTLQIA